MSAKTLQYPNTNNTITAEHRRKIVKKKDSTSMYCPVHSSSVCLALPPLR